MCVMRNAEDPASRSVAHNGTLPVAYPARNDAKQWMRCRLRSGNSIAIPLRRSPLDLAPEMLPLVQELSFGLGDRSSWTSGCDDASRVERIAARGGLAGDDTQVVGDEGQWVVGATEALQLRVPSVAARATEKHRLRKERF